MNCVNHPETAASAFCRECGKPMCPVCQREALGSIYCAEHVPVMAAAPPPIPRMPPRPNAPEMRVSPAYVPPSSPYTAPYAPPADPSVHPGLALVLGFAPGVGAIYNGQYAKGLVHAVVFGLLVSFISSHHSSGLEPLLGILIAAFVVYQAFEAYHTARKRRYGVKVEEFSSLINLGATHGRFPVGAILLIGLGFVLLLDTTDIISIDVFARFWPALLIFFGVYMLYNRLNPAPHNPAAPAPSDRGVRQ